MTRRVAAIDLGTNSTRLLVADVDGGRLQEVERLLTITRLGDGVDASGRLSDAAIDRVVECVKGYAARAKQLGAEVPLATATSAVRDAENGDAFLRALADHCGVRARKIDGRQEARLTLRGVASGRTIEGRVVVCDIGGGSTELIAGDGAEITLAISLDMGCVRMSERHLVSDPPATVEISALRAQVASMLPTDVPAGDLIGVAGTVTTLATIDLGLDREQPELIDGHRLGRDDVERELSRLAALPLAQRREVRGLMPERAATIVAGTAILAELMSHLGASQLEVSERDVLHGAALEAAEIMPG
ncbi:MAG: exopolyphosphatase / guanosine-5-triphosphate,3-diphosphate pyrophosphatase [Gaiellales bacterium]|nr:exopolyphosphatase / guanosine-5-triphosphate,3-diphosphate pyrophosphatase [Gaiellales bacterium]